MDATQMNPGDTIETSTWRIHLGALSVKATHIVNAGKRGKKCFQACLYNAEARLGSDLLPALQVVLDHATSEVDPATMLDAMKALRCPGIGLEVSEERGVDVDRADDKIEILGACVEVRASSRAFFFQNRLDVHNLETLIQVDRTAPAKVLAWVKANRSALETMPFSWVTASLRSMGIRSHYYCAVD